MTILVLEEKGKTREEDGKAWGVILLYGGYMRVALIPETNQTYGVSLVCRGLECSGMIDQEVILIKREKPWVTCIRF